MFHVGHLNIVERAKQNCDYLIIGVCDDSYVVTQKHKTPIINEIDRARIISALKYVDEVIIVNSDIIKNKLPLIMQKHINIVFDGDDYKDDPRYVELAKHVEVMLFPYTKGISSSTLRDKI